MGGKQLRILVVAWFQPLLECFYVGSDWVGSTRGVTSQGTLPRYLRVPCSTCTFIYPKFEDGSKLATPYLDVFGFWVG